MQIYTNYGKPQNTLTKICSFMYFGGMTLYYYKTAE